MSKVVEFVKDSYPHCKGDVVVLSDEELKAHNNDTYVSNDVKLRAEAAQEAEVVEPAEEQKKADKKK